MFSRHRAVGFAMAVFLVGAASAPAQTTLRYKFQEGDGLEYVSESKIKMSNNIGGIQIGINVDQTTEMSWKVKSVNKEGAAVIGFTIKRMVMNIDAPPPIGMTTIDSNDKMDPDNLLAQQFSKIVRKMVGAEIVATMSPTGHFSDIKMPKELEKELAALTGGLGVGGGSGLEQFTGGGIVLPKEAVEKGKTWTHKTEMKMPMGTAVVDLKYTYDGPKGSLERILVVPRMTLEGKGMTMKTNEEKSKGAVLFDNAAGRISESTQTQFMTATIEMGGLAINMDMEMVTTLKLKSGSDKK